MMPILVYDDDSDITIYDMGLMQRYFLEIVIIIGDRSIVCEYHIIT